MDSDKLGLDQVFVVPEQLLFSAYDFPNDVLLLGSSLPSPEFKLPVAFPLFCHVLCAF